MAPDVSLSSRTITTVLVVALAQFMQMLDAAVISIALPPIARDFDVSSTAAGFGITIYVLAASIVIPASAWFADRIGAKRLFVLALGAFAITSILCGLSTTLWQFIAARGLQGVAGALMAPVGQMILLRSVERSQLLRVMNLTSAPVLIAPVIGPPLGGLLTTWFGWPWIFYINLPAATLAIVLAWRWLPPLEGDRRPFDRLGFLLNAAALAPLLWGLHEVGNATVPHAIPLIAIVAGAVIGVMAVRHLRRADHPLLSLAPLRHQTFRLTSGSSTILIRLPITALIFVLPILLQVGFGMTAFLSGILFLAHSGGDLLMKLFTTRTFRRFGYRATLLGATSAMGASIAACALIAPSTPLLLIAAILFASGCFRSFVMTGLSTLAFSDVSRDEMPSATTLNQVAMQLATALGISASSLILNAGSLLRGMPVDHLDRTDFKVTFLVMATMAFAAVPLLRGLSADAGSSLSGHRPNTRTSSD